MKLTLNPKASIEIIKFSGNYISLVFSCSNSLFCFNRETYYWVSTKHLRSWKKFAMKEISLDSSRDKKEAKVATKDYVSVSPEANKSSDVKTLCSKTSTVVIEESDKTNCCSTLTLSNHNDNGSDVRNNQYEDLNSSESPNISKTSISSPPRMCSKDAVNVGISCEIPVTESSTKISECRSNETDSSCCDQVQVSVSNTQSHNETTDSHKEDVISNQGTDCCESPDSGVIVLSINKSKGHFDNITEAENQRLCDNHSVMNNSEFECSSTFNLSNGNLFSFKNSNGPNDTEEEDSLENEEKFNDDILCEHGR